WSPHGRGHRGPTSGSARGRGGAAPGAATRARAVRGGGAGRAERVRHGGGRAPDWRIVRAVIVPDKMRGTATAREVAAAAGRALAAAGWEHAEVPVADGGEGTLDALGGPNRTTTVTGPLGEPV